MDPLTSTPSIALATLVAKASPPDATPYLSWKVSSIVYIYIYTKQRNRTSHAVGGFDVESCDAELDTRSQRSQQIFL